MIIYNKEVKKILNEKEKTEIITRICEHFEVHDNWLLSDDDFEKIVSKVVMKNVIQKTRLDKWI